MNQARQLNICCVVVDLRPHVDSIQSVYGLERNLAIICRVQGVQTS